MIKNNFILTALSVVVGLMFYATPSEAVHKGAGGLTCGQCHTMHNSQGRVALNTNPNSDDTAMILLRGNVTGRQNIHNLCLQCHGEGGAQDTITQNGSNVVAPKVYMAGSVRADGTPETGYWKEGESFSLIGSGGDFKGVGNWDGNTFTLNPKDDCLVGGTGSDNGSSASLGKGHSLGCQVIPPGATGDSVATPIDLSCTACHDPHGADSLTDPDINLFRNLRKKPIGGGGGRTVETRAGVTVYAKSAFGGVTGKAGTTTNGKPAKYQGPLQGVNHIWPIYVDADNQNAYGAPAGPATTATEGIGSWCAQCHDKWHEALIPDNKAPVDATFSDRRDWKRHPVDNPLVGDTTPNSSGGVEIIKFSHYENFIQPGFKVPAAQSGAGQNIQYAGTDNTYYANDNADKVFCFSCHFVHGSPYNDILRWNYTEAVEFGSQKGNAIESNIGCQQCHNR